MIYVYTVFDINGADYINGFCFHGNDAAAKNSNLETEVVYFPEQRNMENLWEQVFSDGTPSMFNLLVLPPPPQWGPTLDKHEFEEGGVLYDRKVYLFGHTEPEYVFFQGQERFVLVPVVVAVVAAFPPFDKVLTESVENAELEIVPMNQLKLSWVPYIPPEERNSSVERLRESQIFILTCSQRRTGIKHLNLGRQNQFENYTPYFYPPLQEEQSSVLICPIDPIPVLCLFNWERDELEEFTDKLIEGEELPAGQKEFFMDFVEKEVRKAKMDNRKFDEITTYFGRAHQFMEKVSASLHLKEELTVEDCNMLFVAYKNVIGAERREAVEGTLNVYKAVENVRRRLNNERGILSQVVAAFPPFDKVLTESVENAELEIVPMNQLKLSWVPYIPPEERNSSVERLRESQIFILTCSQRRTGIKHLNLGRQNQFENYTPYFYPPLQEEQSSVLICPIDPIPVLCLFNWEQDELEEFTDKLIEGKELPAGQKEFFMDLVEKEVRKAKMDNRKKNEARNKAIDEMSAEKRAAFGNIRFYKFYPMPTANTPDISMFKCDEITTYFGRAHQEEEHVPIIGCSSIRNMATTTTAAPPQSPNPAPLHCLGTFTPPYCTSFVSLPSHLRPP
ncbi:hypothetical protein DH2020_038715 [Rehmannia glutinosa]|uniref:Uncharacterized protein n=1 Tax=Rehmannia glutinosa TaxID=99300 RepID=A0ABR0UZH1_REHGL